MLRQTHIATTGYTKFYVLCGNTTEIPYLSTMSTQSTEEVPIVVANREHSSITYQRMSYFSVVDLMSFFEGGERLVPR